MPRMQAVIFENRKGEDVCSIQAAARSPVLLLETFSSCAKDAYLYRCFLRHPVYLTTLYFDGCTQNSGFLSAAGIVSLRNPPPYMGRQELRMRGCAEGG